ncbi:concanavalin A-like lectin/glucanase domain-containing protein [Crucibulum laeve]|uniref:Glucanase n=1 Tax=Crucibulum laeve TaxID=68775 RepID=A0A5C3LPS9_9AGAR|nr:concanavalin A-like lectin/glucanase domain-containing protein [Crucibulum laeve]
MFPIGQQVGTTTAEVHPSLLWKRCNTSGGCTNVPRTVTPDFNWHWLHSTSGYTNCYTDSQWDMILCSGSKTCTQNGAIEGANYASTCGITTTGDSLTLKLITQSENRNVSSRYEMFKLLNMEFYYPRNIKFIQGDANVARGNPSDSDPNARADTYGACCNEMGIWEANSISTTYTPHPCTAPSLTRSTDALGRYDVVCDPDGWDFSSFRMGEKGFYGKGLTFLTDSNSTNGNLKDISRMYVQDGKVIHSSKDSTTKFCNAQKVAFDDDSFKDDHHANMLWLDSNYLTDGDSSRPGIARGTRPTTSGKFTDVESNAAICRCNDIDSTFSGGGGSTSVPPIVTSSTTAPPAATQVNGGNGWMGPEVCVSGSTCPVLNPCYSRRIWMEACSAQLSEV